MVVGLAEQDTDLKADPADGGEVPPCPHRPSCPGCPRYGEPGIDPDAKAALDVLAAAAGLPAVSVVTGGAAGFRLRARLAIRGRRGAPKIGLFAAGSHRVVTVPRCRVHHPLINEVAAVLRTALVDAEVAPYSDTAHAGLARYLQVVVERDTQTAQVVLVGNCPTAEPLAPLLDLLRDRLGPRLQGLWFNANTSRGNAILGPQFERWAGRDCVVERFVGAAIHYPPGAFGQSNLAIAGRIIEHLRGLVPPGARVAEFHAGVGAIGLSLLDGLSALALNELHPASLDGLARGTAALDATARDKVRVLPGPAADATALIDLADVVICDPPRKGLEPALAAALVARPPAGLAYVSCSLDSLRRDLAVLTAAGRLRLAGLTAFDLIPYTRHVETVAWLESSASVHA